MSISDLRSACRSRLPGILACALLVVGCSDDSGPGRDLSVIPDQRQDRSVKEAGGDAGPADVGPVDAPAVDAGSVDGNAGDAGQADSQNPCFTVGAPQPATSGPKGKADVLFVVDNSSGMAPFQQALLAAIPTLEAALKGLPAMPDYHIGVVTTDLGAGPFTFLGCNRCGRDGRLQSNPSACQWGSPSAGFYLTNTLFGPMAENFECLAAVGDQGCGFEQPLESAAILLTTLSISAGFLRPDASLIIVVVSNEDDCSAKDPALFDPSDATLGPAASFRCFQHGITCNIDDPTVAGPRSDCAPIAGGKLRDVSTYVSLFQSMKPAGRVGVVVVAGPATPVSVSLDGVGAKLDPSCSLALVAASAEPGIRLKALADAFGARGKFHSICGSFAGAMADIAAMMQSL